MSSYKLLIGDCIESMRTLDDQSVNCCVTSPPYFGLRDYGVEGQAGLESTPEEYIANMVNVFREVKRVLRDDGTLWLNIGDSYAGNGKGRNADGTHQEGGKQGTNTGTIIGSLVKTNAPGCKPKDLIGIPWMLAFALRADGWYLRQDIIWQKPNAMPESVKDRCTKSHEYIFLLTKSPKYYFDHMAIAEDCVRGSCGSSFNSKKTAIHQGGRASSKQRIESEKRNIRSVWSVSTKPYSGAHFATFPPALIEPCILAGCPVGGTVLDPFGGCGTTAGVAIMHGRNAILCELNQDFADLVPARIESIIKSKDK